MIYQTDLEADFSTSSLNTLISHLTISTIQRYSLRHSLWAVLDRSIRPDPILLSPSVDSLKVLFFKLEIIKVGLPINTRHSIDLKTYPDPLWGD
jgi:hypothetical protein